jgi:translation initiation factor IF-3
MKPKIDEHDIDFKTRTAAKLLKQGDKVKVTVMFRGREITHPQIGKNLLDRVLRSLEEIALMEKDPSLEGRHMTMILAPDKKKIAASKRAAAASKEEPEADDAELEAAVAAAPVVDEDDYNDEADEDDEVADEELAATTGD